MGKQMRFSLLNQARTPQTSKELQRHLVKGVVSFTRSHPNIKNTMELEGKGKSLKIFFWWPST